MRTFTFTVPGARLALLLTITRTDEEIIRVCTWPSEITVGADTWLPCPGLKVGDLTERNDGTPPTLNFDVGLERSGIFDPGDVDYGKFEGAAIVVDIVNAAAPAASDYWFDGKIVGDVEYGLDGIATFEAFSNFATPRDIFVRKYKLACDADFGDEVRCKVPTWRDDRANSTAYALRTFRRHRFASSATPEDYEDVILEVTTAGTTAASAPAISSTVSATTTDGSVVWTTRTAYVKAVRIAQVPTDPHNLILDREPYPADEDLMPGSIVFRSGQNRNRRFRIAAYDASAKQITTYLPMGLRTALYDWAEIAPDCNWTMAMCSDKYDNAVNYRGFDKLAGVKQQITQLT